MNPAPFREWPTVLAAVVVTALFIGTVPPDRLLFAPLLHLVAALVAFGCIWPAGRNREVASTWTTGMARYLVWSWAASTLVCLTVLRFQFPDVAPDPLATLALPSWNMRVRSVLDVSLFVAGFMCAFRFARPKSPQAIGSRVLCAAGTILILGGITFVLGFATTRDTIAFYTSQLEISSRAFRLFDLGNIVWCGALFPLALAFDRYPVEVNGLLRRRITSRNDLVFILLITLSVVLLAPIMLFWTDRSADSFPAVWWVRKFLSILLSNGLSEEATWRAACGAIVLALARQVGRSSHAEWTAIAVTSLLFAAGHLSEGVAGLTLGVAFGLFAAVLVIRFGLFWLAVLLHALVNLMLISWN